MAGDALTASGVQQQRAAVPPSPPARAHPPKGANGASDSGAAPGSRHPRPPRWPQEKDDRLRELWAAGLSASRVGSIMGITNHAVIGRAHKLHLPSRPSPIIRDRARQPPKPRPLRPNEPTLPRIECVPPPKLPVPHVAAAEQSRKGESPAAAEAAKAVAPAFKPIRPGACRFPLWGNGRPTHRYCGKPTKAGSPYCPKCHALCHTWTPAR